MKNIVWDIKDIGSDIGILFTCRWAMRSDIFLELIEPRSSLLTGLFKDNRHLFSKECIIHNNNKNNKIIL